MYISYKLIAKYKTIIPIINTIIIKEDKQKEVSTKCIYLLLFFNK